MICYVKTLPCIEIPPNNEAETSSDCSWSQLFPQTKTQITLGVIYRPPYQDRQDYMNFINNIKHYATSKNALIVRDFNLPDINWDLMEGDTAG